MEIKRHKQFIKEFHKAKLSDSQFERFVEYINAFMLGEALPAQSKDHKLEGKYSDCREFHIGGDMLVIYLVNELDVIVLLRIGTHSQLFR